MKNKEVMDCIYDLTQNAEEEYIRLMGTCIVSIAVRRWIGEMTNDPRAARRRVCCDRAYDRQDGR